MGIRRWKLRGGERRETEMGEEREEAKAIQDFCF